MRKKRKKALLFLILSALIGSLVYFYIKPDKEVYNWGQRSINPALKILDDYYKYYNTDNFDSLDSSILYYSDEMAILSVRKERKDAFNDYRETYGKYIAPKYSFTFRYPLYNMPNFIGKYFCPKELKKVCQSDQNNLANTYKASFFAGKRYLYVNFTGLYKNGEDKTHSFVFVEDKNGELKILKFPGSKRYLL